MWLNDEHLLLYSNTGSPLICSQVLSTIKLEIVKVKLMNEKLSKHIPQIVSDFSE